MKYLIVLGIALLIFYYTTRWLNGKLVVKLYIRDPKAGMLHIAYRWFLAQPKIDKIRYQSAWPAIRDFLSQPEFVDLYKMTVENNGQISADNLVCSFTQLFIQGRLPFEIASELERCWKL
jgi:hypothetical protein